MDTNNTQVNAFSGGMKPDVALDKLNNNSYIYAENIRVVSNDQDSYGKVVPIQGARLIQKIDLKKFKFLSGVSEIKILSSQSIRDYGVIIASYYKDSDTPSGWFVARFNCADNKTKINTYVNFKIIFASEELLGGPNCDIKRVSSVLRYESNDNIKLYIADGYHNILLLNIMSVPDSSQSIDQVQDIKTIESVHKFILNTPILDGFVPGNLTPRLVQYSYQLYRKHLSASSVSIPTKLIPIVKYPTNTDGKNIQGDDKNNSVGTGVKLKINISNEQTFLDRILIYRISYVENGQEPLIECVNDSKYVTPEDGDSAVTFKFVDTGNAAISTLTLEEYNSMSGIHIIPKVLESKNDYLFAANIKNIDNSTDKFKDFDSRSYSFDASEVPTSRLYSASNLDSPVMELKYDGDNTQYDSVEKYSDCFNIYNNMSDVVVDDTYDTESTACKFDGQGFYGGSGKYINWRFIITQFDGDSTSKLYQSPALDNCYVGSSSNYTKLDNSQPFPSYVRYAYIDSYGNHIDKINDDDLYMYMDHIYTNKCSNGFNYSNPVISYAFKSLKRDELYRYAIILYGKDGSVSSAKWIADIRTPNQYVKGFEAFAANTVRSGKIYDLSVRPLGIEFNVDIKKYNDKHPTDEQISHYEIVRCNRTESDIKNLTQGVLSRPVQRQFNINATNVNIVGQPYTATGVLTTANYWTGQKFRARNQTIKDVGANGYEADNYENRTLFQFVSPEILYQKETIIDLLDKNSLELHPINYLFGQNRNFTPQDGMFINQTNDEYFNTNSHSGASAEWSSSISYSFGDVVTYNGVYFQCVWPAGSSNQVPTNYPYVWAQIPYSSQHNVNNAAYCSTSFSNMSKSLAVFNTSVNDDYLGYQVAVSDGSSGKVERSDLYGHVGCKSIFDHVSYTIPEYYVDVPNSATDNYSQNFIGSFYYPGATNDTKDEYKFEQRVTDRNYNNFSKYMYAYNKLYEQGLSLKFRNYGTSYHDRILGLPDISTESTIGSDKIAYKIQNIKMADELGWNDFMINQNNNGKNSVSWKYTDYGVAIGQNMFCNILCGGTYDESKMLESGNDKDHIIGDGLNDLSNGGLGDQLFGMGGRTALIDVADNDNMLFKCMCARTIKYFSESGENGSYIVGTSNVDRDNYQGELLSQVIKYDYDGDQKIFRNSILGTFLCNIQHNVSPYNGYDYMSRSLNNYYSCGNLFNCDVQKCQIFDGDCFIMPMEYVSLHKCYFSDLKSPTTTSIIYSIPVETSINLAYTYGSEFSRCLSRNGVTNLQIEPSNVNNYYVQDKPLYIYNTVYSSNNYTMPHPSEEKIYDKTTLDFDYRCFHSNVKTNNESIDNWVKFQPANYIDVDTRFGQVTNLREFNNKLVFWQDSAVGLLSVNDRSQIIDNNGQELILGSGGVLSRYDYLDESSGMHEETHCDAKSSNFLYWYDNHNFEIKQFDGQQITQLNKIYGTHSLMAKNQIENDKFVPIMFYDHQYNELVSKTFSSKDDNLIAYNEQNQMFTSIYTIRAQDTITHNDITYLLTSKGNELDIFLWNSDSSEHGFTWRSDTDGNILHTMLDFVINKDPLYTKVFDNQEIVTHDLDIPKNYYANNHKYEWITELNRSEMIGNSNIQNMFTDREGNIRYAIPRAINEKGEMSMVGNRIKGKMLRCIITDMANNQNTSLSYIITKYRMSWS